MGHWRDHLHISPRSLASVHIDIKRTALMIIDMQLYDLSRDHGLAFSAKKFPQMVDYFYNRIDNIVLPNNVLLLEYFREKHMPVVHITVGPEFKDGRDQIPRRRRREKTMTEETGVNFTFYRGSEAHKIHPHLQPIEGELVVNKNSTSPFTSTGINYFLRNMDISGLIITGVATNVCVETTARVASDMGFECVLVEDACATFDQESHEATLKVFARFFGEVWSAEETVRNLNHLL